MQYLQQFIKPEIKELMLINDKIDNEMMFNIAKILKPQHKSRVRKVCINIIYKLLFSDDVTDETIDAIDKLFANHNLELFKDDDDTYHDDVIRRIGMLIGDAHTDIDLHMFIPIVNTLIDTELF